jgi:hypothetical protein
VWGSGKELQRASLPFIGETNVVNMTSIYGTVRQVKSSIAALTWLHVAVVAFIFAVRCVSSVVRLIIISPS